MKFDDSRIYALALEVAGSSQRLSAGLPGYLADQLRRAAASIALNFAEGCGKVGLRDRRRFFLIARGSAREVIAAVDVAAVLGFVATTETAVLRDHCDHLCAMLWLFR